MSSIVNDSIQTKNFSAVYPEIMEHILKNGIHLNSRQGETYEILDFKTTLKNPVERCVGGAGRNINIFFLLAEALWIWAGRNDVETLKIFNSRMSDYSDNGRTFNAPYGFRLRHYGHDSQNSFVIEEKNDQLRRYDGEGWVPVKHYMDQIKWVLNLLHQDPNTRRAVISIWNPEFDTKESKDIPCNDLLMFKVRDGKLHLTIANRSNDLHWGLCTNVFQFSFILELMANILMLEVGQQTHNSQSLHIYSNNPITKDLRENLSSNSAFCNTNFYDYVYATPMGFDFQAPKYKNSLSARIQHVDNLVGDMIFDILSCSKDNNFAPFYYSQQYNKAPLYFTHIMRILSEYVHYSCHTKRSENDRLEALENLKNHFISSPYYVCSDYYLLALNWFAARCDKSKVSQVLGKANIIPNFLNEWIGKL